MKVSNKYLFIILAFAGVILITCKKEKEVERDYPQVNTLEVKGISVNGATFEADIYSGGNEEIIDHGFVWGTNEDGLSIENSDRVSLGALSGIGKYDAQIRSTLQVEKKYFVRSFVKTSTHTVYGPVVSFISLGSEGPTILDFEPKTARWGDTITIKGSNFCWRNISNKVFFNGESAEVSNEIQYRTDTSLRVTVPYLLNNTKSIISIEIAENKFYFERDTFELMPPYITDIYPTAGYWGDTITIYGSHLNFVKKIKSNYIKINETLCVADSILLGTKDSIKFKIPCSLSSQNNPTSVNINGISINAPKQIQLLQPKIISFSPKNATWGSELTLYGRFNPMKSYSTVSINNIPATISYCSKDSIKIKVPSNLNIGLSTITYKSNDITTSSTEQFQLIPPLINSIVANNNIPGSYITISGNYFNNGTTAVYINDISSYVYSCTSNTIKAKIPQLPNEQLTVKVVASDQSTMFYSDISIENPIFTDFSPKSCTFSDTIFIYGEFLDKIKYIHLIEQYKELRIAFKSPNLIKALITSDIRNTPATIKLVCVFQDYYGNYQFYSVQSSETFTLTTPIITSISPSSGTGEQEIKLIGENFNPDKTYTEVYFGNTKATVLTTSKNEINIKLNKLTIGNFGIKLKMNGFEIISSQAYSCTSPWTELPDLPFSDGHNISFSENNFGYILTEKLILGNLYQYSLHKYDPLLNKWDNLTSYQINDFYTAAFFCNGKLFILSGLNSVVCFDLNANQWIQKTNFPMEFPLTPLSFTIGNKIYFGAGYNRSGNYSSSLFWEYNPETDVWSRKSDIPSEMLTPFYNISFFWKKSTFVIGGKGIAVAYDKKVWEYNPSNDLWSRKSDFPGGKSFSTIALSNNNKGYLVGGLYSYSLYSGMPIYDDLWEYNYSTDSWSSKTKMPGKHRWSGIGFSIGEKLFIGGGKSLNSNWHEEINRQFYIYNPAIDL